MRIKLKLAGVLFLFSMAFIGCSDNSNISTNKETPIPNSTNTHQNKIQDNSNTISNENRVDYPNIAKNNHVKTPTPLPEVNIPPVRETNLRIEDEVKKIRDKEEVVKIAFIKKTNTVGVRLKSGIVCEFPIKMIPKAEETPDEEVIEIVEKYKNSKMCKDYNKK